MIQISTPNPAIFLPRAVLPLALPAVGDRVAGKGAQALAQPVILLALAAAAKQLFEGRLAAEFRHVAEADDAIVGKAGEQRRDVPRHEQRLDMRDEDTRLVEGRRIAVGHKASVPVIVIASEAKQSPAECAPRARLLRRLWAKRALLPQLGDDPERL